MRVHEVMTRKAVSCGADIDLRAAARLMFEGGFGTLPVVDARGRVIGIVTDRDIAMAVATRERNASQIMVHEAMSTHVRGCLSTDEVGAALGLMDEAGVRRLPVMDATGHLAGILSIDDILLRAVDRDGGIDPAVFVHALRGISSRPSVEPGVNFADTTTPG
jgi:CBS domain-containing protein